MKKTSFEHLAPKQNGPSWKQLKNGKLWLEMSKKENKKKSYNNQTALVFVSFACEVFTSCAGGL